MRVGACQTLEIIGDVEATVGVIHNFAKQPDRADVDLLWFPESFLQGYQVAEQDIRVQNPAGRVVPQNP